MKTGLTCRREPHSGGLRTLKNDIFSITFSHVFFDTVLGEMLDDFELHLGMHFEAVWGKFRT